MKNVNFAKLKNSSLLCIMSTGTMILNDRLTLILLQDILM